MATEIYRIKTPQARGHTVYYPDNTNDLNTEQTKQLQGKPKPLSIPK